MAQPTIYESRMTNHDSRTIVLTRRQLLMLPTREGLLFALVLLALFLAAINYGNGLAYALTFLLAGAAVVSMLYTDRNLYRLRVAPGPGASVFEGETARFSITLVNEADGTRLGVIVGQGRNEVACVDIPARGGATVELTRPAERRGWLDAPPFFIATRFPLGIFYSWSSRLALPSRCLVYPRPSPPVPWPWSPDSAAAHAGRRDGDDFVGVRDYRPGDSPRHVDWKAAARGGPWLTKQFGGEAVTLWLDYDAFTGLPVEERLSRLCRLVLDADAAGAEYGLRLPPGQRIAPGRGAAHRHACLKSLALFPGP